MAYSIYPNTDVQGNDFGNDVHNVSIFGLDNCRFACNTNPNCFGFTNLGGTCYLKSNILSQSPKTGCTLYIKNQNNKNEVEDFLV